MTTFLLFLSLTTHCDYVRHVRSADGKCYVALRSSIIGILHCQNILFIF